MERCRGILGFLFGHAYEEIFDEEREYFEPDLVAMVIPKGTPPDEIHGYVKKENRTHQYCMCRRCGRQVSKDRKSLFTKEDK